MDPGPIESRTPPRLEQRKEIEFAVKGNRPNIVLIIIDALRFDRLGISGYRPALTPNLDRLARNGVNCVNHFAVGCPSQIAIPGIFTSTLPFDWGGYNEGIRHRPYSFVELLRGAGYDTFGIATCHWFTSHYGCSRGFNHYANLIDMFQWFRQCYIAHLGEPVAQWLAGRLSDDLMVDFLGSDYEQILASTLTYLDEQDRVEAPQRGRSRTEWRRAVRSERELLSNDPLSIAHKIATLGADFHFALGLQTVDESLKAELARSKAWDSRLNRRIFLRSHRRGFEAHDVNRQVRSHMKRNSNRPFFGFVHYFDLHESKLLIPNLSLSRLVELPRDVGRSMKGRPKGQGGRLHDVALSFTDRRLGELIRWFERTGLSKNTLFLITGDHGVEAGIPYRGAGSDLSRFFTDDFLHVPLIIYGPGIDSEEIHSLMSHLDLGPTILEQAGIEIPSEFLGMPLSRRRREPAPYLISENAGKGRCDFDEKTLYFGVRTEKLKVVFEADDFRPRERDVFDLQRDPLEKVNLHESDSFQEERLFSLSIIKRRLDALREARGMEVGTDLAGPHSHQSSVGRA
jgi:arylsulfatase A-like enzyme